jgi:hypothetical protein
MLHTKRVIFMILPLLFVPLVYGMSSTPNVCALPRDPNSYGGSCGAVTTNPRTGVPQQTCCWGVMERGPYPKIGTTEVTYCQTCTRTTSDGLGDCGPSVAQMAAPTGRLPPGVLEDLPTTPSPPPPLFGRNIPLQGAGVFGQPTTTTTPTPIPSPFGQAIPGGPTLAEEGEDIQPMNTTFPTPQPFPPPTPGFKAPQTSIDISPDRAPEVDQDETDDGIEEQPETQQPEDSSEGAETAGPLT